MNLEKLIEFVKSVGVPGAIAFYILARLEPAIKDNTAAIHALAVVIAGLGR